VRSYEEICGTFDSKCGRRPQRSISTTVNGDCSTSHLRQRPAYGIGRHRSKRWSNIATPRRRLKSSEDRSLRSWKRSATCIHSLAKLWFSDIFSVAEPAHRLYYCWIHWLIEWSKLYYRKYWKDIILFSVIVVIIKIKPISIAPWCPRIQRRAQSSRW